MVLLAALITGAQDASAAKRALLIGVSNYQKKTWRLEGPKNDVQVMWRLLRERGLSDIRVLADSLPQTFRRQAAVDCDDQQKGKGCPRFERIRAAFEKLIDDSEDGDFVYIHFSGHGSSMPEVRNARYVEPDGKDEIFLALDTNTAANVITDNQIGKWLEALRSKGANVWIVFDSCNSGDMVRGVNLPGRLRKIDPSELGITFDDQARGAMTPSDRPRRQVVPQGAIEAAAQSASGKLVAFYAAEPDQAIAELELDAGDAFGFPAMGSLSYALHVALKAYPNATYKQLADKVTNIYAEIGGMPRPNFDGVSTSSRQRVLGGGVLPPAWKVSVQGGRLRIAGGRIDSVTVGSLLSLFDDKSIGERKSPLGVCALVREADLSVSIADPIDCDTSEAITPTGKIAWAVMQSPGARMSLRLVRPPEAEMTPKLERVLNSLDADQKRKYRLRLLTNDSGIDGDIFLRVHDNKLWMFGRQSHWRKTGHRPSPHRLLAIATEKDLKSWLGDNFRRWAIARNLINIAQIAQNDAAARRVRRNLDLKFHVRLDPASVTERSRGDRGRYCSDDTASRPPADAEIIEPHRTPIVFHCDRLYFTFTNKGNKPIDVTMLFMGSDKSITDMGTNLDYGRARVRPNEAVERSVAIDVVTWNVDEDQPLTVGLERLLVIAVEVQDETRTNTPQTYGHLVQEGVRSAGEIERGKGRGSIDRLLEQATLAVAATRSASRGARARNENPVDMQLIGWRLVASDPGS